MTLPASGTITFNAINVELTRAGTTNLTAAFIKSVMKSPPAALSIDSLHSMAYYQRNMDGNCPNGNCAACGVCNCGVFNCTNCFLSTLANCVNCDTQKYLQANCNCSTGYNCSQGQYSYDCNCDCNCTCYDC